MKLNDLCAYTAAYIFKPDPEDLLGDEVLIKSTSDVFGDRKCLKSLMPRHPVDQQQYALEAHKDADDVRQIYQATYMTPAEHVSRGNHWYLMVVDFVKKKLVWLDSLHCATRDHPRRRAILRMAIFVEEILMHESYGTDVPAFNQERMVSAFSLYQPRHIQQQRPGSNDCGVWISKWMIECPLRSEYGYITVNTATRMKLAIHLVKAANNELYNDVLAKAAKNWTVEEKKRNKLVKL
ncbi:hypothetical protein TSUD_129900 [Trifolium subterraneum]|uniref:Ubiquitin-like protease family profile domain-containing protein n=1 Tax=Trifolium subterraneum TaxID=3900 RepID=A0A2Z6PP06_TRISU|nr:hypothetical protein TSUD_129900 [Trifolium subterraneum]